MQKELSLGIDQAVSALRMIRKLGKSGYECCAAWGNVSGNKVSRRGSEITYGHVES